MGAFTRVMLPGAPCAELPDDMWMLEDWDTGLSTAVAMEPGLGAESADAATAPEKNII